MVKQIDRKALKQGARELVREAQVSAKGMTLLYLGIIFLLDVAQIFCTDVEFLSTFLSILTRLMSIVLGAGFVLYAMSIRRGERAEYLTLFDGFSFVGKIIVLSLLVSCLTGLWMLVFIFPAIVIYYRYYFALYNLYENPELGILEAMRLSSRQTFGYKRQLLLLDLSYLGWIVAATLPSIIYNGIYFTESIRLATEFAQGSGVMPVVDPSVMLLPDWAWTVLSGVCSMIVAPFYLVQRRCVELSYFDTIRANPAELPANPFLPK